ncbi:hypothetical protein KM043_015369 [Ampulex compressa]|nr:hypothetical protein KM043_015369 [Ampulex compressa]
MDGGGPPSHPCAGSISVSACNLPRRMLMDSVQGLPSPLEKLNPPLSWAASGGKRTDAAKAWRFIALGVKCARILVGMLEVRKKRGGSVELVEERIEGMDDVENEEGVPSVLS